MWPEQRYGAMKRQGKERRSEMTNDEPSKSSSSNFNDVSFPTRRVEGRTIENRWSIQSRVNDKNESRSIYPRVDDESKTRVFESSARPMLTTRDQINNRIYIHIYIIYIYICMWQLWFFVPSVVLAVGSRWQTGRSLNIPNEIFVKRLCLLRSTEVHTPRSISLTPTIMSLPQLGRRMKGKPSKGTFNWIGGTILKSPVANEARRSTRDTAAVFFKKQAVRLLPNALDLSFGTTVVRRLTLCDEIKMLCMEVILDSKEKSSMWLHHRWRRSLV